MKFTLVFTVCNTRLGVIGKRRQRTFTTTDEELIEALKTWNVDKVEKWFHKNHNKMVSQKDTWIVLNNIKFGRTDIKVH